jgi:hypothetical protein
MRLRLPEARSQRKPQLFISLAFCLPGSVMLWRSF